jgi:hypothetical protein
MENKMPIVQLPGGEVRDEIRQPLYDTVEVLAGAGLAGVYNFFSTINTPAGVPKTIAKTNMTTPGQLQTAVSFRVQGLCLDASNFQSDNTSALPIVLQRGGCVLNVGVKTYWQGPSRFAAGRMSSAFATAVGGLPLTLVDQQFGWPSIQPVVFQGRHVIDINPLQNFLFQLSINAQDLTVAEAAHVIPAGEDLSLVASLKGLQRRPVQ